MRFAYADPPYPGQSLRLYGDHPDYAGEVDHAELIARLTRDYPDGWALSTSASTLPEVLALCPYARGSDPKNPGRVEPDKSVRVLAWVKPNANPRPVCVQYSWEPVILWGGRPFDRESPWTVRDSLILRAESGEGLIGSKPALFAQWLFRCLGARPDDELDDLYPGSGAISRAWTAWTAQLELA